MMLVSHTVVRPHEIVYTMPNGSTMASSGSVKLNVTIIFDHLINDYEVLDNLSFDIVEAFEDPNVDCIISGDDITANQILVRIPKQHEEPIMLPEPFVTERLESAKEPRNFYLSAITRSDSRRQHISEFFDFEQEDMGEPEKEDSIDEALQIKSPMESTPEPVVEGSEKFQKEMREMLREYIDLLQNEVSKEPAKVAPLVLNVDEKRWTLPKANARHRTQSTDKDKEIKRQVDLMVALGLIQKCNRTHYSQVHLVPKPQGKWRFCIDYRYLNDCSKMEGGVLPRIKELLHRIGDSKAKYYAVMDLTSGYHQTPMDPESIKYTAFVTAAGVFEWKRVPMGLKGAPTYFQREMSLSVLGGLLGHGVELYLDDCIVYGATEEEFKANLRLVFERFRAHNITLNLRSVKLGYRRLNMWDT